VLEPGLAEGILRDIVGEPGALPLLSHSLFETWRRRSDRMLTLLGYLQSGAVRGAIAKTAETVYQEALTPEQKTLARNIFLRLTELGEGTEDTRRRVRVGELTPRREQAADVEEVLGFLVEFSARLIEGGQKLAIGGTQAVTILDASGVCGLCHCRRAQARSSARRSARTAEPPPSAPAPARSPSSTLRPDA